MQCKYFDAHSSEGNSTAHLQALVRPTDLDRNPFCFLPPGAHSGTELEELESVPEGKNRSCLAPEAAL